MKRRKNPWAQRDETIAQQAARIAELEAKLDPSRLAAADQSEVQAQKIAELLAECNDMRAMWNKNQSELNYLNKECESHKKNYRETVQAKIAQEHHMSTLKSENATLRERLTVKDQQIGKLQGFLECLAQESGKLIRLPVLLEPAQLGCKDYQNY